MDADHAPIPVAPVRADRLRLVLLWAGFLGGPFGWAVHIAVRYPLVPFACSSGHHWLLHAATVLSVTIICASGILSYGLWRSEGARDEEPWQSRAILGFSGVALAGFFLLVALAEVLPTAFQHPCE